MPAASVNGSCNNYVEHDDVNGNCGLLDASQKMTHPYLFLLFSMTSFNSHYQDVTTLWHNHTYCLFQLLGPLGAVNNLPVPETMLIQYGGLKCLPLHSEDLWVKLILIIEQK